MIKLRKNHYAKVFAKMRVENPALYAKIKERSRIKKLKHALAKQLKMLQIAPSNN